MNDIRSSGYDPNEYQYVSACLNPLAASAMRPVSPSIQVINSRLSLTSTLPVVSHSDSVGLRG